MSHYSKILETMCWLEQLAEDNPGLKYNLNCRCVCESVVVNQERMWKNHKMPCTKAAREWLQGHCTHECYVGVQFEGLKPNTDTRRDAEFIHRGNGSAEFWKEREERQEQFYQRYQSVVSSTGKRSDSRWRAIVKRLRELADRTPFAEEAHTARRLASQIEKRHSRPVREKKAEPSVCDEHLFDEKQEAKFEDEDSWSYGMRKPMPEDMADDVELGG